MFFIIRKKTFCDKFRQNEDNNKEKLEPINQKLNLIEKNKNQIKKESFFKIALRNLQEYGKKGLLLYYLLYLSGLGIIYVLIENGILDSKIHF